MMYPVKISYLENAKEIRKANDKIERFGEGSCEIPEEVYVWGDGGLELNDVSFWYIVNGKKEKEIRVALKSMDYVDLKYDRDLVDKLKGLFYNEFDQ